MRNVSAPVTQINLCGPVAMPNLFKIAMDKKLANFSASQQKLLFRKIRYNFQLFTILNLIFFEKSRGIQPSNPLRFLLTHSTFIFDLNCHIFYFEHNAVCIFTFKPNDLLASAENNVSIYAYLDSSAINLSRFGSS